MENEIYFRSHPELGEIMRAVSSQVLKEAPDDPVKFIIDFMTNKNLRDRVATLTDETNI